MKTETQQSREADLYLARQFGHLFIREANSAQTQVDFLRVFPADHQAQEQFDLGVIEEDQKRMALGLTLVEYRACHAKDNAVNRGKSHGKK